jgi:hypothetical protein
MRLAAAGLMLATVAWAPAAGNRTGRTDMTGVAQDNAVAHLFDQNQKGAVTPELPWFLKPSDPQKEQQKRLQMMRTAQNKLKFTENRGQATDQYGNKRSDVLYYGGTSDMKLYFTKSSIGFVFNAESPVRPYDKQGNYIPDRPMTKKQIMTMDLLGANKSVEVTGSNKADGVGHFMRGPQEEWIMDIASYHQLTYRNIYDKIDMVVDTRGNSIKYDFVVRPGGDPSQIKFQYKGAKSVSVSDRGSLVIASPVGTIEEEKPYSFQGENQEVANAYQIDASGVVSFNVGSYDAGKTLTIDPTVVYSTYWGGDGEEAFEDVEIRGDGWVAVGFSGSTSIPTATAIPLAAITIGARASQDGLIARYSATNQLLWYAFIGGTQNDVVNSVELEGTGATGTGVGEAGLYIMGTTNSNTGVHGFPTLGTVPQAAMVGTSNHAFVARLNYATGALRWISYKGGSGGATTGERITRYRRDGTCYRRHG